MKLMRSVGDSENVGVGGTACKSAPPPVMVRDRSLGTALPVKSETVTNRIKKQLDDLHSIRGQFLEGALSQDLRAYFVGLMHKKPEIAMNFLKGIMPRDMDTVVGGQERASVLIIRAESGSQVAVNVDAA